MIYVRKTDGPLPDALDHGLARLDRVGRAAADSTRSTGSGPTPKPSWPTLTGRWKSSPAARTAGGWALLRQYQSRLFDAAFVTIALSVTSMPLAMALGLLIALGQALWAAAASAGALRLC